MNNENGVIYGGYICNLERTEELNNRIYDRNIPSHQLQTNFGIRSISTKYDYLPIFDKYKPSATPIIRQPIYNPENTFNPGNDFGPWSGYASNVNNESKLRNQFFAHQRGAPQATYIPSSTSDMYQVKAVGRYEEQPYPELFASQHFDTFNPNTHNLGYNIFDNCTRQQIKNLSQSNFPECISEENKIKNK
jgi:hypothetical protein